MGWGTVGPRKPIMNAITAIIRRVLTGVVILAISGLAACRSTVKEGCPGYGKVMSTQTGTASWYSIRTNRGKRTASGKPLCDQTLTAAHRKLPFGTPVRVTNLRNGKSVVVVITDRGPFRRGRVIDVSVVAAKQLDFYSRGLAPVKLEVLERLPSMPRG